MPQSLSVLMIVSILTSLSLVSCSLKFVFSCYVSIFLSLVLPSLPILFIFSILAPLEGCILAQLLAVSAALCVHGLHAVGVLFPSGQKHGRPQACAGYTSPPRGHVSDPQAHHARSPWPLGYPRPLLRLHGPEFSAWQPHRPPLPMTHRCHSRLFSLMGVSSPSLQEQEQARLSLSAS